MEYSAVHGDEIKGMGKLVEAFYPDGRVHWQDATPPDLESRDPKRTTGRLRNCHYCGSMHPADVVAAIKAGARGELADMKYGWPHKIYFNGVPNPHAGMLESRHGANSKQGDSWFQTTDGLWRDPGTPAAATVIAKFYTVHLRDATPEEKALIEAHMRIHFEFTEDGYVAWSRM